MTGVPMLLQMGDHFRFVMSQEIRVSGDKRHKEHTMQSIA